MPRQQSHLSSVAQSGCAGMCSFYCGVLTVVFLLPACILLAISGSVGIEDDSLFQDDNFNLSFRVAGSLLLVVSLVLMIITICLCSHVCKKICTATTNQADHSGQVLVGGAAPPPGGYHTQTAGGATSYPMGPQPATGYPRPVGTTAPAATASVFDPAPPYPGINIPPSSPPGVEPPTPPPTYDDFINKGPSLFNKKTTVKTHL